MKDDNILLNKAKFISKSIESQFWKLAPILYEIHKKKSYMTIGYESFIKYCNSELYCSLRTAQIAIRLYKWKKTFYSKDAINWINTVPWSYLMLFDKFLNDSNWEEWRDIYKSMKPYEFKKYIRNFKVNRKKYLKDNKDIVKFKNENCIFIECSIPCDVYNRIDSVSKSSGISIEKEIYDTLVAIYRRDDVSETG